MFVRAAFAIALLLLPATLYAQDGPRLALVIGNQEYSAKVGPVPLANLIGLASAGNMGDAVVRCGTCAN
jgi:hypothetical protein